VKSREPIWIGPRDAVAVHDRLLAVHGGRAGLRDAGLLEWALARPRQYHAYSPSSGVVEMAALHTARIVRSRPFVDRNKRIGFVAGILFLELNGLDFTASEEDATQAVMSHAARSLDETSYVAWLKANTKATRP